VHSIIAKQFCHPLMAKLKFLLPQRCDPPVKTGGACLCSFKYFRRGIKGGNSLLFTWREWGEFCYPRFHGDKFGKRF